MQASELRTAMVVNVEKRKTVSLLYNAFYYVYAWGQLR